MRSLRTIVAVSLGVIGAGCSGAGGRGSPDGLDLGATGSSTTTGVGGANGTFLSAHFGPISVAPGGEAQDTLDAKLDNEASVWVSAIEWLSSPGLHHARLDAPPDGAPPFFPVFSLPVAANKGAQVFPAGFGMLMSPHQRLRPSYHYVNPSTAPMASEFTITLRTFAPDAPAPKPVSMLAFLNSTFSIPPHSSYDLETTCTLPVPVDLHTVMSHMHQLGKGIDVRVVGGFYDGLEIYTTTKWDGAPVIALDPPLHLEAGTALRWVCHWQNPGSKTVNPGNGATEEMCGIASLYSPGGGPIGGGPMTKGGPCMVQQVK